MEAVTWRSSLKRVFLEILQNSLENTCARVFFAGISFSIKLQADVCNFIKKETLAPQVFPCEYSKNTFSYRTPLVAASELIH